MPMCLSFSAYLPETEFTHFVLHPREQQRCLQLGLNISKGMAIKKGHFNF